MLGTELESAGTLLPPSRKAFPGSDIPAPVVQDTVPQEAAASPAIERRLDVPERPAKSGIERTMTRFFMFVLLLAVVGAAFYAGRKYKGSIPYVDPSASPSVQVSPTPVAGDDPLLKFERSRREVDNDPNAWLATQMKSELLRQGIQQPLDSTDAEFLYLYGRASLLVDNTDEAVKAFEAAIAKANLASPQANSTLKKEAALGLAAVALKSEKDRPAAQARFDETMRPAPSPSASPSSSPSPSP
jgi:tetratricopeptide (TPR) repeat protein